MKFIDMKKILLLIALSMVFLSSTLSAQNISNTEKRKMNLVFLRTLERLEEVSDLSSHADANEFVSMFRNQDCLIYNDLIGVVDEDEIPLMEYVSFVRKMKDVKVMFRNVRKSELFVYNGSLCVRVSFDKVLSYKDGRGVLYSSEDFFGKPHKMEVVLSYDDFDGTCLIESMEGSVENAGLSQKDHVVYSAARGMEGLMFRLPSVSPKAGYYGDGECSCLSYNSEGQAILPGSAAKEDWYYMQDVSGEWDPDVFIEQRLSADNILSLRADRNMFRVKAYNSIAPAGAFIVAGDFDGKYSIADETGVEARYMFNVGKKMNLGIYGGIGISYNYLGVSVRDFSYSYQLSGQERNYDVSYLGQSAHFVDALLSGGFAMEYAVSRRLSLDFMLGGKAYFNLWADQGNIRCDYTASYGNSDSVHKRGYFNKDLITNQMELTPDVWPCPLSAAVSVGVNYNVTKRLLLSCGLGYEYGLNWYYQSENIPYESYERPITYSAKSKADVINWSMGDSYSLKKRALWLNIGVVFKL